MKVLEKRTGKEIVKGNCIMFYMPSQMRRLMTNPSESFKTAIFQGVASCGKKIIIKERVFDNDWISNYHPEAFNLEIEKKQAI